MRVSLLEIENRLYQYFYINKYEQKVYEEIYELLDLTKLAVDYEGVQTIDLIELIEMIEDLFNEDSTVRRDKIIINDFKYYIYKVYKINENIDKYKYASLPKLKSKKIYKKIDIMNNPNIKSITNEMDYDVKFMKVYLETVDGYTLERYVTDWKSNLRVEDRERKVVGSFNNLGGGPNWYNEKYIIKAEEYSN